MDYKCFKNQYPDDQKNCCTEQGTTLVIDVPENSVIYDGDKIFPDNSSCDCIIFFDRSTKVHIFPVELKSKSCDISQLEKKFVNTTNFISNLLNICCSKNKKIFFLPILIHKGIKSRFRIEQIYKLKIRYNGIGYNILLRRSNASLSEIVSEFS